MARSNGAVLYEGPSSLDGNPIVVIMTGLKGATASKNRKTGSMAQVWIMRSDVGPVEAVKRNLDGSVCGGCRHRGDGFKDRSCYVDLRFAPANIFRAYKAGRYLDIAGFLIAHGEHEGAEAALHLAGFARGSSVRIGAYGDPAAVPAHVLAAILGVAGPVTAYTHQWLHMGLEQTMEFQGWCMASVDSISERKLAVQRGWRTFRVAMSHNSERPEPIERLSQERPCPATAGNKTATCELCLGCGGRRNGPKHVGFVVEVHGTAGHRRAFDRKVG